jgi:hypothetical protein
MDTSQVMNIDQARRLLAQVGVEVPRDMPPESVFRSLNVLLEGVPQQAVAAAVTQGAEVRYGAQAGVTVPPFMPVNYSYNIGVEGRVGLSDVQTGPGLEQSQTFRATMQVQQDDRFAVEKTLLNRLYRLPEYAEYLPQGARDLLQSPAFQNARDRIESNPALRTIARGMPFSFEHVQSEGTRLSYEATVPPEVGRRIAAGDTTALPNPMDPLSMPAGSGVLIRGQDFQGSSTAAGFKVFMAGGSDTQLQGGGFSVRRLEGSMVEIATGPMGTVENSFYLGLGRASSASVRLEAENSLEQRQLSVARLDLATTEGQTAYRQFLESGRVPDAPGPGIPQAGYRTELSIEQTQRLGLYVGSGSIGFDNSTRQQATVSNLGGREEIRFEYNREGQVSTDSRFPLGADGRPDFSQGQYRMTLPNVGPNEAGALRGGFGGTPGRRGLDDSQAVELTMDSAQLMQLRERTREYLAARPGGAETLADLDARRIGAGSLMEQIAGARNAHEVFGAMQTNPNQVVPALQRLSVGMPQERGPLPGSLSIETPEVMRARLEGMNATDREQMMDRFYRAGEAPARTADATAPATPAVTTPATPTPTTAIAADAPDATRAATASGPLLTSREHPDNALFTALRERMPASVPDEQVGVATARARQEGITPERLERVAADPTDPNRMWLIGSVPGFRTMVDLSQPAPPLERTSADLLAARAQEPPPSAPVREQPGPETPGQETPTRTRLVMAQ